MYILLPEGKECHIGNLWIFYIRLA